jgi:predicted Zn-dependent protease
LLETNRAAEAEAEFRAAVLLDGRIAMGHLWLGRALQAQEKLEEAEACYLETIRREPGYFYAHGLLAELRRIRGTAAEALSRL